MSHLRRYLLGAILFASVACASVLSGDASYAANAHSFNAGRIIDNVKFTNANSMSVSEIQAFLDSKMQNCDTNGTQRATSTQTNRQWIEQRYGISPPYRCVRDYRENPDTGANNYGTTNNPAGSLSSAELILKYSKMYNINPQTLIVTLQKENGLITDNIPIPKNYSEAMGFGCPDNRPAGAPACDPVYGSFSTQLYQAARHFRGYMDRPAGWYVPYGVGWNTILWNPKSSCGTSNVYIENSATAALYSYTPYRPNQAALDAQYGTGDGCSAYGNRNFYMFFTDWFGNTIGPDYVWEPSSQGIYKDETKTEATSSVVVGERRFVEIRVRNSGPATWHKNQIFLGTSQPNDRVSEIYDPSWVARNRAATISEDQVPSGSYATFRFWVKPSAQGTYKEYFNLLREGFAWMVDRGLHISLDAQPARYSWRPQSQSTYSDQARTQPANTSQLKVGDRVYSKVQVVNSGNVAWYKGNVNLATSQPNDRYSPLHGGQWLSTNRVTTFNESIVKPGEVATFDFSMKMPSTGYKKEYFNLVAEGAAWMPDLGMYFDFTVQPDTYTWQPHTQRVYTDQTKTQETPTSSTTVGKRYFLQVAVRNSGNTTWYKNNVNLATSLPKDRFSSFKDSSWLSPNRAATLVEERVNPGDIGTFEFWVTAPQFTGERREYFNIVVEGITWMPDLGMYYRFSN